MRADAQGVGFTGRLLSKDIGLFPQASKIGIHRVTNIDSELKSVSQPSESSVRRKVVDQRRVRKRLVELTPRFRVTDPTRFKYVLAHAQPDAKLTARLWRVFERHPELYNQLGLYLQRYRALPRRAAERLILEIEREELYPAVRDALLRAAVGRLKPREQRRLTNLVKNRIWKPRGISADILASAGGLLIEGRRLTEAQLAFALRSERPWWGRAQLLLRVSTTNTRGALLSTLLNGALQNGNAEVALAAAFSAAMRGVPVRLPARSMHGSGAEVLRELGLIKRVPAPACGIEMSFRRMLGKVATIKWKSVFGNKYRDVEKHVVYARALADTNVTAWVNAIDVFDC